VAIHPLRSQSNNKAHVYVYVVGCQLTTGSVLRFLFQALFSCGWRAEPCMAIHPGVVPVHKRNRAVQYHIAFGEIFVEFLQH
jgi:hypothetical protein